MHRRIYECPEGVFYCPLIMNPGIAQVFTWFPNLKTLRIMPNRTSSAVTLVRTLQKSCPNWQLLVVSVDQILKESSSLVNCGKCTRLELLEERKLDPKSIMLQSNTYTLHRWLLCCCCCCALKKKNKHYTINRHLECRFSKDNRTTKNKVEAESAPPPSPPFPKPQKVVVPGHKVLFRFSFVRPASVPSSLAPPKTHHCWPLIQNRRQLLLDPWNGNVRTCNGPNDDNFLFSLPLARGQWRMPLQVP